jgi:hypothetical protein
MVYARTSHNRTVYASPPVGGSGYGFARSWLRHSHAKPPPHFVGPAFATQTLIRAAKTSYTAGTLGEIRP